MKHIFLKNKISENITRPIITKEHGSWAILFVPVITGISASVHFNFQLIFFSIMCIFFLFMSYVPAEIISNKKLKNYPKDDKYYSAVLWLTIYLIISLINGVYTVLINNRPLLIVFGVIAFIVFAASKLIAIKVKKNVWSDLLAVAGLTLSAPVMIYILDGSLTINNLVVWLVNFLFFGSSTVYVHMKINVSAVKKDNLSLSEIVRIGKFNLVYHLIVTSLLITYALKVPSQQFIILAFIPMVIHAIIGTFKNGRRTNFKKLGYALLTYSVVFVLFFLIKGI